jgi:hypothetical protein
MIKNISTNGLCRMMKDFFVSFAHLFMSSDVDKGEEMRNTKGMTERFCPILLGLINIAGKEIKQDRRLFV